LPLPRGMAMHFKPPLIARSSMSLRIRSWSSENGSGKDSLKYVRRYFLRLSRQDSRRLALTIAGIGPMSLASVDSSLAFDACRLRCLA